MIASIFERFLPLTLDDSVLLSNSDSLKSAYGVPLPRMLKLMRVFAQKNNSLRLSLVNKWKLADRCLTYLRHRFTLLSSSENNIVTLLMLESLRCLSVCLEEPETPQRALELTKSALSDLIAVASESISLTNGKDLSLKIAWLSFFARTLLPKFLVNFSYDQLEVVRSWAITIFEACSLEAYHVENDGKLVNSLSSSPLMINVAAQLLKALKMEEHIAQLREKIFTGPTWTKVLNHFIGHQSVLTGFPNRMSQTSVLSAEFAAAYTADDADPMRNYNFPKDVIFESSEDGDPLSVLNVSNSLPCLPDLGMSVCLFYRGAWAPSNENCEAKETTLPAMWWPPPSRSVYPIDVVEPLDLLPRQQSKWTNFLPLIEAALTIGGIDLTPWCDQLRRLRVPPVVTKSGFPHGLMAIESSLMGRYLLHLSASHFALVLINLKLPQVHKEMKGDLWWAAFNLVSCLHFGQEALFIELLQRIIFPVYDLTPIETGGFSETISNSKAPWPPVHESFSQGLAFYAHKLYGEYFADLLQRRSAEMKDIYKPLKSRPSCDLILPNDWFYMPILEAYFHHARPPTEKDQSQVYFTIDPETYLLNATAILGWIRGLLSQQPLLVSKNAFPRGVTASGHFSRILCAILACQSAGALCFNLSGAIIAELVTTLLPRISFEELDASPEEHLPLDLISFYDLYTELLEHYTAISYSSPIFANIILLFLRPAALPVSNYRKALWGEHQATLRSIQLSPSEVFLPEDIYKGLFEPLETTQEVLRAYACAICAGTISLNRQPLITLIVLHHLNRNIYLTKTDHIHEEFVKLLGTSLRFLASRRGTQEVTEWLRLYMFPSGRTEKVPLSELVQANRISVVACGNFRVEDLIEVYKEDSLPSSRRKKWKEFMGN
ncbi:unnamed protein product [Rodentolepis nana]|uniref:RPAP1/MINIYO-like TPR repeats domain-containing protein n=1 Tax=Rodentolepis nana TaxID=102285 RepID=A0A3P7SWQ5_RODNA|nr:unnamed protein product [Rodentolepis nana]